MHIWIPLFAAIDCGVPPIILNAQRLWSGRGFGDVTRYVWEFLNGQQLQLSDGSTQTTSVCLEDETWSELGVNRCQGDPSIKLYDSLCTTCIFSHFSKI